jgi:cytochrome c peroxidase
MTSPKSAGFGRTANGSEFVQGPLDSNGLVELMASPRNRKPVFAQPLIRIGRSLASVCVSVALVLPSGLARSQSDGGHPFTREALLERFDADRDGRLSASEKATLRHAFGGTEVPLLPSRPYRYTDLRLPAYLDALELRELDNTPADNPLTDHGATLGRVLFYDTQLSRNNTVACASCHRASAAFSDPRRFSIGYAGGRTTRNAMALVNLRFSNLKGLSPGFFWDERAPTLEAQALLPIQDEIEMGMDLRSLEARVGRLPYYPPLFRLAFGTPEVTAARVAKAVAQFLRSMTGFDSKFDRAAAKALGKSYSADFEEFTAEENLGKSLFIDGVGDVPEFGCAICHLPPTFAMPQAFNNGLDVHYQDRGLGALGRPSNDPITPTNDGKFKAPSLRNIALTAPYMHDGRFQTLEEVIEHYSGGIRPHPNLGLAFAEADRDRGLSGFKYTPAQKAALVAFLKTLTDEQFISDPRFADPFVRLDSPGP